MSIHNSFDLTHATPIDPRALRGLQAYQNGLSAEQQVCRDYQADGYTFLAERWRGQGGEIDLIFQRNDQFVFVEVKRARTVDHAKYRLSQTQMERIFSSAVEYADRFGRGDLQDMRFDMVAVDQIGRSERIENAIGHF